MKEKFYITTAIAYTSRKPHIGNTYEAVFTDVLARYQRLLGKDVYFLTGTDEHGLKIQQEAEKAGITPQEHVDRVAGEVRAIWDLMNVSYDDFIRTTDKKHEKTVQDIFQKLYEQGDIYKSEYRGKYCTPCETFYTDAQIGEDGLCPDCGRELADACEEAYFFKMSKYQDRLMQYIEENPDFISPEARKKEMVNNFLKPGLSDLCVSRSTFTWGVPVSFDSKHVIYVWIDALSNYITALDYAVNGESGELYKKYWPADVHIIGKDILRFHTIYWPIILMALGEPLPKQVFGHPWLLSGVDKMSKSRGNVIYADELAGYLCTDAVRYYLISEMPYLNDGSITYEQVVRKYNAELVNNLGNLVSRTIAMNKKYFGGVVPAVEKWEDLDLELAEYAKKTAEVVKAKLDEYRAAEAADAIFDLLHRANKYIDETTPWTLAKDEAQRGRLAAVIVSLLCVIRLAGVLLKPFIPDAAARILSAFGGGDEDFVSGLDYYAVKEGFELVDCGMLFARVDEAKLLERIAITNDQKNA
ncbi:MAG: methionine--tRNA ligase [Clostridia bacterium]|nr:methionine--tRNA ligase [Clostridia bacterium]